MINSVKRLVFLIIIALSITSCDVKEVEVDNISNFSFDKMTKDYIAISLNVNIHNPNNFGFNINKVDLDVYLNGSKLGKIYDIKNIHVSKKSNDTHRVEAKIKVLSEQNIGMTLLSVVLNNKAKIHLKGFVYGRHLLFTKKISVDENKTIPIFNNMK